MSPVRVGVLISVALVAAILFAMMARSLTSHPAPVAHAAAEPPPKPTMRVLVAARDLAAGDRLAIADFAWQPWPNDNVNPAYIVDSSLPTSVSQKAPTTVKISTAALNAAVDKAHDVLISTDGGPAAKLVDSIVREPMLKGEPILEAKVVHAGASGVLAVELTPGMRAMSLPLSAESAAGGFVLPGDHVDLVQSRQVDSAVPGQKRFVTMTILKNVKVLAIDQNTSRNQKSAALVGATATLEISPAEAELVSQAKAQGEVSLVLRSYADIGGPTVAGARKDEVKVASPMVRVFRSSKPDDIAVTR